MKITIDTRELAALRQSLVGFSDRRFAAGLATALTRTALAVREAERAEMRDVFDRPTPYTLNSLYVKPATAANLQAVAWVKDQASGGRAPLAWLRWQITGGLRRLTGFERQLVSAGAMDGGDRAVPGRFAKLDQFGNISRGQLAQIFSQLRIETGRLGSSRALPRLSPGESKADRNRKRSAIVGQYRRAGGRYVAFPHGRGKLKPGVYLMSPFERDDPKPVLLFVAKAQYDAIFDFDYVARRTVQRWLSVEIGRAMAEQMQRFKAKQQGSAA